MGVEGAGRTTAMRWRARAAAGRASPSSPRATNTTTDPTNERVTTLRLPSGVASRPVSGAWSVVASAQTHGTEDRDDHEAAEHRHPGARSVAALRRVGTAAADATTAARHRLMASQRHASGSSDGRRVRAMPAISTVARDRAATVASHATLGRRAARKADHAQGGHGEQQGHERSRCQLPGRRARPQPQQTRHDHRGEGGQTRQSKGRCTAHGSARRSAVQPSSSARTASSVRERTPYRSNSRRRWLSTVRSDRPQCGCDLRVRRPADDPLDDLELALRGPAPGGARELKGGGGVDGAAGGDGADRVDDRVELGGLVEEPGRAALDRGPDQRRLLEPGQEDDGRRAAGRTGPGSLAGRGAPRGCAALPRGRRAGRRRPARPRRPPARRASSIVRAVPIRARSDVASTAAATAASTVGWSSTIPTRIRDVGRCGSGMGGPSSPAEPHPTSMAGDAAAGIPWKPSTPGRGVRLRHGRDPGRIDTRGRLWPVATPWDPESGHGRDVTIPRCRSCRRSPPLRP